MKVPERLLRRLVAVAGLTTVTLAGAGVASPVAQATSAQARSTADACLPSIAPRGWFFDVVPADLHAADIDCLWWWGVATGTADGEFLPAQALRRDQAATLAARLITDSGGSLPTSPPNAFSDTAGNVHQADINRLAAAGILTGGPDGSFHPAETITRGDMTALVVKAYEYRTHRSLPVSADYFSDDATSASTHEVNAAAGAGLVAGFPDGTFHPTAAMTREQAASLLARTLDLLVDNDGAHPPGTAASITSVTPVATGRMLPSPAEHTSFCVYDAVITLTWEGATRLDAYPVIGGTRMAPGDTVSLPGDGSTTVTVRNNLVPLGKSGQVEVIAGQITNGPYKVLADVMDPTVINCRVPG